MYTHELTYKYAQERAENLRQEAIRYKLTNRNQVKTKLAQILHAIANKLESQDRTVEEFQVVS